MPSTEDPVRLDDRRLCRAILLLFASLPKLAALWTDDGPTPEALELRDAKGGPLSTAERILLLSAFDIWDRSGGASVCDLLLLDPRPRQALCSLVIALAYGPDTVDSWIVVHSQGIHRARQ